MNTDTVTTTPAAEWVCLNCGATYGIGGPEVVCGTIAGGEICSSTLYQVVDVTITAEPAPAPPAKTPGFGERITIWFTVTSRGKPRAWYYSRRAFRAFPLPLADAEIMRATETAEVVCCHPWKPHTCGKEEGK